MSIKKYNGKALKIISIYRGFRPVFRFNTFAEFRIRLGFTLKEVAELTDKSETTIKRLEKYNTAPGWLYLLLYTCAGYVLDKDFFGFQFLDGRLTTGTDITRNYGFTRAEITEYAFFRDYQRGLERERAHLKSTPPAPAELPPAANIIQLSDYRPK